MEWLSTLLAFAGAMVASLLPHRHWNRMPAAFPMVPGAFASGVLTLFAGAAIGIPGFLRHAAGTVSMANEAMLAAVFRNIDAGFNRGMVQGFSGLSIFTFLLLTPTGWVTIYLAATGAVRMGAAWFDDPVGDPILTAADEIVWRTRRRQRAARDRRNRERLEGPEIPDRVVRGASAGMPGCDLVVVAARRKPGWERGVVVLTAAASYRIGEPTERTIAGRLRTLYPLTEHRDLEAIRKSVRYELPAFRSPDDSG
jgi:hypothetical protein